jgi:biotin-dependent carboxylase-like uncharacterized protein
MITVLRAGPLTTVQDLGRPGFAHLGVPRSGALDQPALHRANALVGNDPSAAGLETTLMGCRLRFEAAARIALTGATCTLKVDGVAADERGPLEIPAGAVLEIGRAITGVRSYLAVAGGLSVEPVLGSRSTDTLSGLGPPRLADGQALPIGRSSDRPVYSGPAAPEVSEIVVGVWLGPRAEWVAVAGLFADAYGISPVSNRVACRLAGPSLSRTEAGELPPEGLVLGAIQVPPDGQPLIFLADHPTTGGYPVVGVVDDVTPLAQARPGTSVRFRELD